MNKNIVIGIIAAACAIILSGVICIFIFLSGAYDGDETAHIYINKDDSQAIVKQKLTDAGVRSVGFSLLSNIMHYSVRGGKYAIQDGENIIAIFRKLRNGQQEPVNLTIPSARTLERLASYLSNNLMIDSLEIINCFNDSTYTSTYGYSPATLPALFIPNTYQVYWDISIDNLMKRMQKENNAFWEKREEKAKATGFSHTEICTIASIVEEETANNAEKPMIAGMYIKRLQIGMPLQADPTVKFAVGDFSLKRIYHKHLTTDSPYNTYMYEGLPPGPIRIASIASIDAVLNYVHHNYIYMCAKEDFSGTHNFAATYDEHLRNARKYTKALNERGIK